MKELSKYVTGHMTVLQLNGREIETGKCSIFLYKLSMQGMIIISNINFPEGTDTLLQFQFTVKNKPYTLKAKIDKWISNSKEGQFTYMVMYETQNMKEEDDLFQFVNTLQLANKNKNLSRVVETSLELSFA